MIIFALIIDLGDYVQVLGGIVNIPPFLYVCVNV